MELDKAALRAACYSVERKMRFEGENDMAATQDAITDLAQRYVEIALEHVPYLEKDGLDPNIVVRAVRYIDFMHAIPPMGDDGAWFRDMLDVLISLVRPGQAQSAESIRFLHDVEAGLQRSFKSFESPES